MKEPLQRLSRALSRIRPEARASLVDLPDRITKVLEAYDDPNLNELHRSDIYNLINGALILSETLADETYPAPVGVRWCTYLIEILCRIVGHLENRPAVARLGILWLPTRELDPTTYSTIAEANEALSRLRNLGVTRDCLIVPVTITSGHVAQPPAAPDLGENDKASPSLRPPSDDPHREAVETSGPPPGFDPDSLDNLPIPNGVRPS